MRIERASADDVAYVALHMRQRDLEEFLAVSPARDRDEVAAVLRERFGGHPDVLCAFIGNEPVAIGAMIQVRPNVSTLLFYATDRFPELAFRLTRFIKHRVFPRYIDAGVHRIECVSLAAYPWAHRWLQTLGLWREAELLGYGKNGEPFVQFSWVDQRVRPAGA